MIDIQGPERPRRAGWENGNVGAILPLIYVSVSFRRRLLKSSTKLVLRLKQSSECGGIDSGYEQILAVEIYGFDWEGGHQARSRS